MLNRTSRRLARFAPRVLLAGILTAGLSLCAASAHADELCTLKLKDGRTITGILVLKNDTGVTLRPEGGDNIAFASAEIASISLQKSPHEEYADKRAVLKDDDMSGRYSLLLQFYYANQKSASSKAFAKAEAEQLAKDFPDSEQIKTLRRVMTQAIDKPTETETPADTTTPPPASDDTLPATPSSGAPVGKPVLLSEEGQNLLRLYQLDFQISKRGAVVGVDAKSNVVISKDVVEELFKLSSDAEELRPFKQSGGESKFRNLPVLVQLDLFFQMRARTLYPKIKIKGEPASLQAFRTQIHSLLAPSLTKFFAAKVPGLIVSPKSPTSQAEAYTNFLALSLASIDGHPVIDRDAPESSLLLQWGLPREVAKYPAPEIKGWKPYFSGKGDTRFQQIRQWIKAIPYQVTAENIPLPVPGGDKPKPGVQPLAPLPSQPGARRPPAGFPGGGRGSPPPAP